MRARRQQHDPAMRCRDFAAQLARARLGVYYADSARIAERLRHGALHERSVVQNVYRNRLPRMLAPHWSGK
jgi:hypothetical protein